MKDVCGTKEIATYLDISISEIRKLVREKRIPYFRIGNRIKFDLNKINAWLDEKEKKEIESQTMLLY